MIIINIVYVIIIKNFFYYNNCEEVFVASSEIFSMMMPVSWKNLENGQKKA